jgi:hypothetical protein
VDFRTDDVWPVETEMASNPDRNKPERIFMDLKFMKI